MVPSSPLLGLASWPIMILSARQAVFSPGRSISRQVVDSGRLLLVCRGTIRYTVESTAHLLRSPTMLYVPPRTQRHWNVHGRNLCDVSYAEFVCPDTAVLGTCALHASQVDLKVELPAFERVIAGHVHGSPTSQAQAVTELCAILARFLPAARALMEPPLSVTRPDGRQRAAIDRAVRHITAHFHEPAVLDELGEHHGLSEDHFRRQFKQLTGLTPHRLMTVCRMREARYLLRQGERSVKQVAAAVGYDDPLYFSRRYRSFWGHPPRHEVA